LHGAGYNNNIGDITGYFQPQRDKNQIIHKPGKRAAQRGNKCNGKPHSESAADSVGNADVRAGTQKFGENEIIHQHNRQETGQQDVKSIHISLSSFSS
jgi:hypothetical protein